MTKADKEGQRKAPILRFKGFTDDWEQRKLNDFGTFHKGKGFSKNDVSSLNGTPVILYGMLYTDFKTHYSVNNISSYINEFNKENTIFSSGNEIIFPSSGETAVDIARSAAVQDSGIIIGGDLIILKINSNTELKFIPLIFLNQKYKRKIASLAQGKSIVHIHANDLKDLEIFIPQKSEQIKISNLIDYIEKLLTLYERKLKLVKLIYKELENKVYNNDLIKQTNFTKVKLGEILKEKNIKSTYEDQYPVLSSTNSGIELRNGRTNSSSNIGYKVLSKDELVLSPQNLWLGNININFDFKNGLVSPSYKVFSLSNDINTIYLNSLLHHPKMMYLYKVVSVQGASVVRRNLDIEAFENLTLKLPSIEAQNKIGNLLNKSKQLIDSLEKKKVQISKIKTTLLNTMFI